MKKLSLLFLVLLYLPLLGAILGVNGYFNLSENRNLSPMPQFSWQSLEGYTSKYTDFFNDHFGFRPLFLEMNSLIKYKILRTSTNTQVALGKNGWLFYSSEEVYLDDIRENQFSRGELSRIASNIKEVSDYLTEKGIKFYFLVGPKSQSVYPEELPGNYQIGKGQTRLEQLSAYLGEKYPEINFINPTKELKAAKGKYQVYFKHDTHWNNLGAFIGYEALIERISRDFSTLKPHSLGDYRLDFKPSRREDLAILLGWSEVLNEQEPVLTPKFKITSHQTSPQCSNIYAQCLEVVRENQNQNLPRLLVYRDSFGTDLIPFLSENFSHSRYIWKLQPHPLSDIEGEKPDLVVYEITERDLAWLLNPLFDLK